MSRHGLVARPLSLRLADAAVEDTFLHTRDCEVLSVDGSVKLRIARSRDTGARVFLCVDATATGASIDSVLLDRPQAAYLRAGILRAVGSLKADHAVVLRGVQFKAREAQVVARALAAYLEEG